MAAAPPALIVPTTLRDGTPKGAEFVLGTTWRENPRFARNGGALKCVWRFGAGRGDSTASAGELADIRRAALELVRELAHALNLDGQVTRSMLERFVLVASCDQNVVRGGLQHLAGEADALCGSDDRGGSHSRCLHSFGQGSPHTPYPAGA